MKNQSQDSCSNRILSPWVFSLMLTIALATLLIGCSGGGNNGGDAAPVTGTNFIPAGTFLPVVTIDTTDGQGITSKEIYVTGTYRIAGLDGTLLHQGDLEIKGRGNSTWSMPKNPYKLKLAGNTALLGMPANKHWVLLANYADKTLIRNEVAFDLSRMLGMEYTTRSVFVELFLNGSYEGVYQLTEHIRIGKDRVNIPELKITDTEPDKITGGYLIEVDTRRGENFCFDSTRTGMVYCVSNPETLLEAGWEARKDYIVGYINQTDEVLFGENFKDPDTGYAAYLDVDSAVHYYLINELFKNPDAAWASFYMYKKRNGKLTFGPVWDFDIGGGNYYGNLGQPEGWRLRDSAFFTRLFEDPAFKAKVEARWKQMKDGGMFTALLADINSRALFLAGAEANNFQRWPILLTWVWPNRVVTGSYQGEIDAMKEWLTLRVTWMDGQLSD